MAPVTFECDDGHRDTSTPLQTAIHEFEEAENESVNMPLVDFGCSMQIPKVLLITVAKSSSHHLSQNEIAGDNPCSRHLSGSGRKMHEK